MSGRYAEGTTVTPESSQAEIAGLVRRYGATAFASGYEAHRALVQFTAQGRTVRFVLTLPDSDKPFRVTEGGRQRNAQQAYAAMQAEERRLWRALALAIKAKLEVVGSGIATFEEEFMAHIVLPDGRTVGEHVTPAIESSYASGTVRPMLALDQ